MHSIQGITHVSIRNVFYTFWVMSLLLQACFTELIPDEAYYWLYSRTLDWGYFDHPPIVAVLIKAGDFLWHNEFGVRLLSVVMSTLSIYCWEKIVQPKDLKLFYLLIASIGILHFIGFLAIPDAPLLFTASLYLLLYKQYLTNKSLKNTLLLGLIMAVMLMSKYHGVLIIAFTVLSNLKLLYQKSFWIASGTALALLIPHVIWQYTMSFPSLRYHLFERSSADYHFTYTLEYIVSQMFVLARLQAYLCL